MPVDHRPSQNRQIGGSGNRGEGIINEDTVMNDEVFTHPNFEARQIYCNALQ